MNYGEGAEIKGRVEWSHQLTKEQSSKYTAENILGDWAVDLK